MKIAILHGARDLRIEERPLQLDRLAEDEIHIKTEITAFKIGTDRGNYEGAEPVPGSPDFPRWVGDSNLGVVRAVGSAVSSFQPGDRVVGQFPHQSEYVTRDTKRLVKVPRAVDSEDAVFAWLYSLSSLCYRKAQFRAGENVAVIGLGVLGLGAVALGPNYGARVIAIGNSPVRLEMSKQMGAHESLLWDDSSLDAKLETATDGAGIDLVILTANPWPAYRTAIQCVRPGGRVAIVALPGRGEPPLDFNPLDMRWFYLKGISLIAVKGESGYAFPDEKQERRFSRQRECEFMLSLMATGRLEPKRLITHRFRYTEIAAAYEMAYDRDKHMLGVIFQWK